MRHVHIYAQALVLLSFRVLPTVHLVLFCACRYLLVIVSYILLSLYQTLLRSFPPDKQSVSEGKIGLVLLDK